MKKIVLAVIAAMTMSIGSATAQDVQNGKQQERKRMNQKEMIQKRTEETVKQYGLNEEQAGKLLELNKKYAGKLRGPQGRHPNNMRPGGRPERGFEGKMTDMPKDSMKRQGPPQKIDGEQMKAAREEMRKNMEAYEAELQKIMSEEQYQAYKADMEKRMKDGRRRFGGQRPHKNDDNK